jgi:hypothetical protein
MKLQRPRMVATPTGDIEEIVSVDRKWRGKWSTMNKCHLLEREG